jgi:pimeloyl-ACP methyl ester carboxylesterase
MDHSAIESGTAHVNGTQLYYEACGSGRPVLFLHGFTLDHRMWRTQVEALASRYRVVTYDARGFGRSMVPDTTPYRHYEDAAALCEYLGLRRVVVVGHSIGAHQVLELAIARPELVSGLVMICTSGLAGIPFPDDVTKMFADIRAAASEGSVDAAKKIWASATWFVARENPALARELDAILADYSGWHWTHANPAKGLEPAAAERLGELRIPALVVEGGRDLAYNALNAQMLLERIAGAARLSLPHCTHMANMDDPDPVNAAIAALADRCVEA